jgi:transcriptional regulator with XRE-family HTH domain
MAKRKLRILTKRLKQLQGKKTLRTFAEQLGIGQSTLHNYLKGRVPQADFIPLVCTKTGCTADWLLGCTESGNNDIAGIRLATVRMELSAMVVEMQNLIKELEE